MNLKSKTGNFANMRFAYLIVPDCVVHNDLELYEAVRKEGRAVIRPFEAPPSLKLLPPISLTPREFEEEWRGD